MSFFNCYFNFISGHFSFNVVTSIKEMDITVLKVGNEKLCDVSASCPNWQNIALLLK